MVSHLFECGIGTHDVLPVAAEEEDRVDEIRRRDPFVRHPTQRAAE
jgi:hypothetical protein